MSKQEFRKLLTWALSTTMLYLTSKLIVGLIQNFL